MGSAVRGYLRQTAVLVLALFALSCEKSNQDDYLAMAFNPANVTSGTRSVFLQVASNTDWTLSFEGGKPEWVSGLSVYSGSGNRNSIVLSMEANAGDDSRSVTLIASAGSISRRSTLTQRGRASEIPPAWIELPGLVEGSGCDMFTHFMRVDGERTRNYSYYFDYDNRVSLWVAYPLNTKLIGKGSRSDTWGVDPNIPLEKQPIIACDQNGRGGTYKDGNAGWRARGHQCPSADRLEADANRQTFYGTNMTPQLNDRFNATIWANLEGKVRTWAGRCDTLYVVTGCIIDGSKDYVWDNPSTYNSIYGTNYSKKKVTIPRWYFKAVVRYAANSTVGYIARDGKLPGSYLGLAALLEHKDYSSGTFTKSYVLSIDKLEERLGYDLFAALPDIVGKELADKIEAEDPTRQSWWGLN